MSKRLKINDYLSKTLDSDTEISEEEVLAEDEAIEKDNAAVSYDEVPHRLPLQEVSGNEHSRHPVETSFIATLSEIIDQSMSQQERSDYFLGMFCITSDIDFRYI